MELPTAERLALMPTAGEPRVSLATGDDVAVWVRVAEWMIVDGEPPRPDTGSMLRSVGVRASGEVTAADPGAPDLVAEMPSIGTGDPHRGVYALTGVVSNVRRISVGTGRHREPRTSLAEFVLTVNEDQFQVSVDGPASDVLPGSRVTVTGALVLVGEYEWDAFALVDTRADWIVTGVVPLSGGDIGVNLVHTPGGRQQEGC
jgi:hypothetical protein